MIPDERKVKESLETFLKSSITLMSFFHKGKKIKIEGFKIEGPLELTVRKESNTSFFYLVSSWANIGTPVNNEGSFITKPMNFNLNIEVIGDDVVAVEDNRINIADRY